MTLKYESEILFDLMKRDGDDTPSDVLPYESELKEKYLEQVEGAYPKLQDYRSEWLNYKLNAYLPADFPDESVSNVTNATFENVVPYAYGSAILKGSTKYRDIDTGEILDVFDETKNLELVSVKMPVLTTTGKNLFDGKWIKGKLITEDGSIISDNSSQYSESFIRVSKGKYISSNNGTNRNVNIFKYDFDGNFIGRLGAVGSTFTVDGDCLIRFSLGVNNTDYFQFEQGTVATIYEPFKSNILTVNEDVTLRSNGDICDELNLLTRQLTQRIGEDGVVLSQEVVKTVDLTVTDQDGNTESIIRPIEGTMHVSTSSQTLQPLLDMSVPVEATTQNLMSFANIVEEEK